MKDHFALLIRALDFAAHKHRMQRRKDQYASPYINHPIQVAEVLQRVGEVEDGVTLAGALLHDTLEDTDTSFEELVTHFGEKVAKLVTEVTDDKRLPKAERKRLQIVHAPHLSSRAKLIKLSDKICNVRDVLYNPPHDWQDSRRVAYLDWSVQVIAGVRGCHSNLEAYFDEVVEEGRKHLVE